jgi:hypothetical protein
VAHLVLLALQLLLALLLVVLAHLKQRLLECNH